MGKSWSEMSDEERAQHKENGKRFYQNNKEKILLKAKKYREENKEYIKDYNRRYQEKNKERLKDYNQSDHRREIAVLSGIRRRATARGLRFDLTVEDINNPGVCPILGIKIERSGIKNIKTSPSVDRIIPELGYVKGNIQVISNKANTMKSDATPEELRMFARWVLKTFPEEPDGKT